MVQFLKAPETSGEQFAAEAFAPMLTIKPMGRKGFGCEPLDAIMAERGLEEARNAMLSGEYGIVILDEINIAVHLGLVEPQTVLELMDAKPENVELVLTGRYAHPKVIERADCVLEVKKIKHHFDKGVEGREGIEY
jgi:cob(I)alamin adenosyltransferase